ncbi:RraA family protein [Pluralibacter gergoviae]|uniref:RraA family protein n=1 Tax=Pluralibacter gergoviae TaxID=61647 RepID=UPI000B29CB9B|nr:hypothetical protein [Pluralibacter gergoviae]EKV0932567.1 hypothetical protein [Pluralibacter gergoviae]EKV6249280.1 hypothetical protein [Pluralibacter gergoviae]EKW9968224.1 hypothetical protein [Pluralibacter gergoviae]ELD4273830.1 hypothetical protein [Pluralibacter gergoviae]ELD4279442.1 hypothetical protein [Pluralibacter gergoviae]
MQPSGVAPKALPAAERVNIKFRRHHNFITPLYRAFFTVVDKTIYINNIDKTRLTSRPHASQIKFFLIQVIPDAVVRLSPLMNSVKTTNQSGEKMNIDELIAAAKTLSTPELSDALDYFSLPGVVYGIKPVTVDRAFVGTAWTVRYIPVDSHNPGSVGDFIDQVTPRDAVVIDNAGRTDCTVWGGILSQLAAHRGIAGTVIHGVCRDTAEARDANYPVYALGNFMRTGKDRVQVAETAGVINLGGTRVCHGDIIAADSDGVVVLDIRNAEKVILRAMETSRLENLITDDVLAGMSIKEARQKHHYHTLQRNPLIEEK